MRFCLLFIMIISVTSNVMAAEKELLRFKSAGNDFAVIEFVMLKDKTFSIEGSFSDTDEDGSPAEPSPPFKFDGTFTEAVNTYDLKFKSVGGKPVTKEAIEKLTAGQRIFG